MVVVAIIGILAAIAVPNYQRFTAKSKQSEAKANLAALYSAERAFQSEWQVYNTVFQRIGYAPTGMLRYQHGFLTAADNLPSNYTGDTTGAADSSTATYCTQGAGAPTNSCNVSILPVAPAALPASTAGNTTFTAAASGDIDGDAASDQWTINEQKTLSQPAGGDDLVN
jgi:type IV pilus assembly protein PilA